MSNETAVKRKAEHSAEEPQAKKKAAVGTFASPPCPKDAVCVNTIRCLAPALPLAAKSGHPGAPMGCAVIAHVLWGDAMNYAPSRPSWWNRDRFVLSNGHACALQYTMLHLSGYSVTLDDLKKFRSLNSITPGHPEVHMTPGVEVTTGPLGQGMAQAVGLAMARENLAATFNKPEFPLFNNYTYCILGDGCMQEGVASEACSLAGHLGLGSLIAFYDDNKISIDGDVKLSFTECVVKRFESYNWHIQTVEAGNTDVDSMKKAVVAAKAVTDKPSLIVVKTIIGYGSKIQNTGKVHGAPLSEDDLKNVRKLSGFNDDIWDVNQEALDFYRAKGKQGDAISADWEKMFERYKIEYPTEGGELVRRFTNGLPDNWISKLPTFTSSDKADATRNVSEKVLNAVASFLPELIGGSADLMESNKTHIPSITAFQKGNHLGRYIHFGVREHAMSAISNGLAAYGGFRPFNATFLNFYTYAWGAVRVGALSRLPVFMIATHDSIDLGEDGPTHQPIETAALFRATPNVCFIRPADGNETSGAYAAWLTNTTRPCVAALSRSNLPQLSGTSIEGTLKGAYILSDFENNGKTKICLAGSGSETQHAVGAAPLLQSLGYDVRVVSMPCWELFEEQPQEYRRSIIPEKKDAVCAYIEALSTFGFARYFEEEASIGMHSFGNSAPGKVLMKHFKFTAEDFAQTVDSWAKQHRPTQA